jgi:hypothetical protein
VGRWQREECAKPLLQLKVLWIRRRPLLDMRAASKRYEVLRNPQKSVKRCNGRKYTAEVNPTQASLENDAGRRRCRLRPRRSPPSGFQRSRRRIHTAYNVHSDGVQIMAIAGLYLYPVATTSILNSSCLGHQSSNRERERERVRTSTQTAIFLFLATPCGEPQIRSSNANKTPQNMRLAAAWRSSWQNNLLGHFALTRFSTRLLSAQHSAPGLSVLCFLPQRFFAYEGPVRRGIVADFRFIETTRSVSLLPSISLSQPSQGSPHPPWRHKKVLLLNSVHA